MINLVVPNLLCLVYWVAGGPYCRSVSSGTPGVGVWGVRGTSPGRVECEEGGEWVPVGLEGGGEWSRWVGSVGTVGPGGSGIWGVGPGG